MANKSAEHTANGTQDRDAIYNGCTTVQLYAPACHFSLNARNGFVQGFVQGLDQGFVFEISPQRLGLLSVQDPRLINTDDQFHHHQQFEDKWPTYKSKVIGMTRREQVNVLSVQEQKTTSDQQFDEITTRLEYQARQLIAEYGCETTEVAIRRLESIVPSFRTDRFFQDVFPIVYTHELCRHKLANKPS
jgi:hypothetical protein